MSKRTKLWIVLGSIAVIVVAGLAATRGEGGTRVQAGVVGREDIQARVSANGKIQAVKKVDISANVMGQVTRLAVKEGDVVKAGDFLMEIDPARIKASVQASEASFEAATHDLEQSRSRLAQAEKDFQRAEASRKAGIISQSDYDQARTALDTLSAAVKSSERRVAQGRAGVAEVRDSLRKTTILAPMDGIITARRIEQGETAVIGVQNQPGTVLLTISDMSRVEAEMEVDEASIPNVKLGQAALVRIDAYPNQTFEGEVTEVGGSPILKQGLQEAIKFKVKVLIKNPPATLKPGLSAQAEIHTGRRDKALAIPIQALVSRDLSKKADDRTRKEGDPALVKGSAGLSREEEGVYVVEGKKVKFVPVKTGLLGDLTVEITSGLKEGDQVVTGPFRVLRELKDGKDVKVEAPKSEAKK